MLKDQRCRNAFNSPLLSKSQTCKHQWSNQLFLKNLNKHHDPSISLCCLQINISYCSITDMGLLALANISCLQSMTILHVKGLSPSGLTATLMACGGLTKVKLHVATKSLLPLQIIEHIKSRGCVFQWIHKPISTGLLPTFWPCCCLNDNC